MRHSLAASVLTLAALGTAVPALAIPAFARRYQVECHFCHDGYPKLNTTGERFKERGFRLEREDNFDASKWLASVPVVVRGRASRFFQEEGEDQNFGALKGISAGNLGKRFSYWVDDGLFYEQEAEDKVTHAKPDNAWLRVELVSGGKLHARVGRMELDLPFTNVRSPHLFSYDIYFANTGFETDTIGQYQEGLEVGGDLPQDVRWSAAVVKGRNSGAAEELSDDAGKFDANLFLRASKRVAKHRLGAFAYLARNTLALSPAIVWDDNLLRLGADANVWLRRLNLYGVYMYGRNDNSIASAARPSGTGEALSFSGGFVQADYHAHDRVVVGLRFNGVSRPPGAGSLPKETFTGLFPGIQVFLFEHGKVSFEYGFQNKGRPGFGSLQIEAAF